jgi:hypothetical protein
MVDLQYVLKQLKQERRRAQKELERLEYAISAFGKLVGRRTPKARLKFSAATREKIAGARRAQWPKLRGK